MKELILRLSVFLKREQTNKPGKSVLFLVFNRLLEKATKQLRDWWHFKLKKDSTFNKETEMFMCSLFPKKVLDAILMHYKPSKVLDLGCGQGVSLKYFLSNGVDGVGVENSSLAIQKSGIADKIVKFNLNNELDLKKDFDLVWCFEVIEHIHPKFEKNILKTLTRHAPIVVLSAARPGQGGHGHFNEQLPEYWIEKFHNLGVSFDGEFSNTIQALEETHCENLLCFVRSK